MKLQDCTENIILLSAVGDICAHCPNGRTADRNDFNMNHGFRVFSLKKGMQFRRTQNRSEEVAMAAATQQHAQPRCQLGGCAMTLLLAAWHVIADAPAAVAVAVAVAVAAAAANAVFAVAVAVAVPAAKAVFAVAAGAAAADAILSTIPAPMVASAYRMRPIGVIAQRRTHRQGIARHYYRHEQCHSGENMPMLGHNPVILV
jgi:hypothetical protein